MKLRSLTWHLVPCVLTLPGCACLLFRLLSDQRQVIKTINPTPTQGQSGVGKNLPIRLTTKILTWSPKERPATLRLRKTGRLELEGEVPSERPTSLAPLSSLANKLPSFSHLCYAQSAGKGGQGIMLFHPHSFYTSSCYSDTRKHFACLHQWMPTLKMNCSHRNSGKFPEAKVKLQTFAYLHDLLPAPHILE